MVKISKLFTIDQEFEELLKPLNASNLVNNLLKDHFSSEEKLEEAIEEKKKELSEVETIKKWRDEIIVGFQVFNKAKLPPEEWVNEQIENRKKQFQISNEHQ